MTTRLVPTGWRSSPRAEQRARAAEDRLRYARPPASLRREIDEELAILAAGEDVSTVGLTPGRARAAISALAGPLRWQQIAARLAADGNTPELIAANLDAEVARLTAELVERYPADYTSQPDAARRVALAYMFQPVG